MVNKVVLIGNLGRDPELFHTQSGQPVARLSLATNKVWTKNGERQRRTEWHRAVVWARERSVSLRSFARERGNLPARLLTPIMPAIRVLASQFTMSFSVVIGRAFTASTSARRSVTALR